MLFRWAIDGVDRVRLAVLTAAHAYPDWGWIALPLFGLAVGCTIGWLTVRFAPDAPGSGIPHIEAVLRGLRDMPWKALLPVKFAGGALGIGTGFSLGLEGPITGVIVGHVGAWLLPALAPTPTAFAVLGMAAVFTASVRAPLTGITLILEMTGEQGQLFALCAACLVAYLVAEALRDRPIYEALLDDDLRGAAQVAATVSQMDACS